MKIGPVVRPKAPPLGEALAIAGKPKLPPRPIMHRNGQPPTMAYHTNHPMLTSTSVKPALPTTATQGVNSNQLNAYLRALRGNQ